jgi:creatinine amidohydrolase
VLPTIQWGLSPYWLPFAGTISLRPETILAIFADIGRSVAAHGFRRMIILNGHGGNAGLIAVAATQMAEWGIRATALPYWALLGNELGAITPHDHGHIGHAGQTETSIQLHLQPEAVQPGWDQIKDWTDLESMIYALTTPGAYAPPLPLVEAPNGIYGDVTAASADLGERIVTSASARLAQLIRTLPRSEERTS